jgi:transcription-repair coupling factor (superfamily II helicase)
VPTALADAASQAHICLSAGSPIGAVVVARAAVEAVAKDHGITGGDLKTKIERMHADGHITATMRDAAMEIRFAGNEAAHGDVVAADVVEERPAIEDAAEIVGLMDSILVYVYQEPARIAKIRYKREIREQDAHLKKLAGLQPGDQVKHETHGVGTVVSLEGEHVWEAFSVAGHYLGLIADSIYPSQWPASLSRADYEAR